MTVLETLLAELESLLYGYNYAVFLRAYQAPFTKDHSAERYITQVLDSHAVIGGVVPTSGPEILEEVERSLRYAGDEGSGPKSSALASPRFESLLAGVLSELDQAMADAEVLAQFWLRDGHPAYPEFWDFAFVIAGPPRALVFIGSSSD